MAVKKKYYNADSLERALLTLERRYGMGSEDFYERAISSSTVEGVPRYVRNLWASLYRDFCRLSGDDFASTVRRTLELA